MAPDPAPSKSRCSRYRSNDAQHSRTGEQLERGSQRSETAKGKGEKEGGGMESGRGVKRWQHGDAGDEGQGVTSGSWSSTNRSFKRWRGDAIEPLNILISSDRWDGGAPDTLKETVFAGKSKQESDLRSGEGIIEHAQLSKEGGQVEKGIRTQKVSKTSLISESRAITVMDLQETDTILIDRNIRMKDKVSHRREATSVPAEVELGKRVEVTPKSTDDITRLKRRWDRAGHNGEDLEDAHVRGNVDGDRGLERERKKEKSTRDRGRYAGPRLQSGRRSEGSRASDVDGKLEVSGELDNINEFKIQEELRNVELEKELENRIRRRREESGDRDWWKDDGRERDGKRHLDTREEHPKEERQKSRRERRGDRYESRQHMGGSKLSESRHKDKYYESDRECRSHREDRHHGSRSKDPEEQSCMERGRHQDHRDRKNVAGSEADRSTHDKVYKDEPPDRERSHPTSSYVESPEGTRSEHWHKRAREGDVGTDYAVDRDHSWQRVPAGEAGPIEGSDLVHNDRLRLRKDDQGTLERSRGSPRDHLIIWGKVKANNWRTNIPPLDLVSNGPSSPNSRVSTSSRHMDNSPPRLNDQRSPQYLSQRSPSVPLDTSSAPSQGRTGHGDWFEPSNSVSISDGPQRRPTSLGFHIGDRHNRLKWHTGADEEVKGAILRVNQSMGESTEGFLSPQRIRDEHLSAAPEKPPLHGQDSFQRGMGGRGMMEARAERGGWWASLQAVAAGFDSGSMDHLHPDDLSPRDRNERARHIPPNRRPGSPMVRPRGPQLSSLPVSALASLPPPPPFRPGIDNPAVLGPLHGVFDGSGSQDQGRGDRKGGPLRRGDAGGGIGPGEAWRGVNIGTWNSRNQVSLPCSVFPPFPPQFAPHPPAGGGGFSVIGQQFPGQHIFPGSGGRPLLDMGFGGGRFLAPGSHIGEGRDGYHGLARGTGWHGPREVEDGRGPRLLGTGDGWEGPHNDDRLRHGQIDWERGGLMGVRGWDRDRECDMWDGRGRDGALDFMSHRYQMEPPPPHPVFLPARSSWGMPCDDHVSNDVKTRQERPFDNQEVKKNLGGIAKLKFITPSGRTVTLSERKLTKFATPNMDSILSQVDISPDLAGAELYAHFHALVPLLKFENLSTAIDEDVNATSWPKDEDLMLEGDPEAEALISCPNLLAKILPPFPVGLFEEAVRLYRKPETNNCVQKSSRGSFVLPLDPSNIKMPTCSLKLNRIYSVAPQDQPATEVERVLDQLDVDVVDEKFIKPNEMVNLVDRRQEEHLNLHDDLDVEVTVLEDWKGEASQEEFMSLHLEVAEYSDRECDTEMDVENVEIKPFIDVEDGNEEVLDSVGVFQELRQPEEVGVVMLRALVVGNHGSELKQDPSDVCAVLDSGYEEDMSKEDIFKEVRSELLPEMGARSGIMEKPEDIGENHSETKQSSPEREAQVEMLPRIRKRRASSRLLARSVEAHAGMHEEVLGSLQGQGSIGIHKVVARGTARSSQRRSKCRGSTR